MTLIITFMLMTLQFLPPAQTHYVQILAYKVVFDIATWISHRYLQLHLFKTWLLVLPAHLVPLPHISISFIFPHFSK